jgi:hypothetical protein
MTQLAQVRLTADSHTHEGKQYSQGAIIEMPADSAQWLIDLKRAEPVVAQSGKKSTSQKSEE